MSVDPGHRGPGRAGQLSQLPRVVTGQPLILLTGRQKERAICCHEAPGWGVDEESLCALGPHGPRSYVAWPGQL